MIDWPKEPRRSSGLAGRRFRAATRARSCCKMLMVPLDVFSLLEMGRVTVELGTTGNATMEEARRKVINRDAAGSMIDRCSNMGTIPDFVAHYIYGDELVGHTAEKIKTWMTIQLTRVDPQLEFYYDFVLPWNICAYDT